MSYVEPARKVQFLLKCMDFKKMHGFLQRVAKKVPLVGPGTRLVVQSCDFRAGAAEVYFAHKTCTAKLRFFSWTRGSVFRVLDLYYIARFFSWSCGSVLGVLDSCYKVALFELELRKCTSRTRLVLHSCDLRAGAAEVSVLCIQDLYYKVAIVQLELRKCTSRTRLVLQSCDFSAGAAEVYFATRLVLQSCDFRAGDAEVYFAY